MISADPLTSISWVSMIRSLDSYTDIVNNVMTGNTAETLLQGARPPRICRKSSVF